MPFEEAQGGSREAGRAGQAARARAARDQPLRLLQLPRHQGLRERRSRSAPSCRKKAASSSRGSTSRSSHDIPHTSKIAWFRTKLHDPRVFDQGRVLQPLDKLRMPNFDFADEEIERLLTAIMSFQREIQPPAGACRRRSARRDFLVAGPRRWCTGATASAATSSKASGGDFLKLVADPSLGPPLLTPEGRARAARLALRVPARADHDPAVARRPDADLRPRRSEPERRDQLLRRGLEQDRPVPDATRSCRRRRTLGVGKELFELLKCQQCHVLGAIPEGSADVEPGAGSADGVRPAAARLDSRLAASTRPTSCPGTRMPAFWPDHPKSFYPQLGGDAEAQIRAIRDHLLTLRGGPSPRQPAQQQRAAN